MKKVVQLDRLPQDGIAEIREYLGRLGYPYPDEDQFDWRLLTSRGKLVRRISRWLYESHRIKLTAAELSQLGNIISVYGPSRPYWAELRPIDWRAGDFGDDDSCFWGEQEHEKDILFANGVSGFCLYDPEGKGIARSLVAPPALTGGNGYIVFNAYGPVSLAAQAHLLAQLLEREQGQLRAVPLGTLYAITTINNLHGFAVAPHATAAKLYRESIVLELTVRCEECRRLIGDDEDYERDGDEILCPQCYEKRYEDWEE